MYGQVLSTSPVWNFGVHLNPVFTTPIFDGASQYDNELKPSPANIGLNTGINIQFRIPEMTFGTGVNIILKTFTIRQKPRHFDNIKGFDDTRNNHYNITSTSTSYELPLEVSYCLHHHDKKMVYDIHAIAGGSYELNRTTGYNTLTSGNISSIVKQDYTLPKTGAQSSWVNLIAGFKIHAILRVLGLIDYGLIWHMPIETTKPYTVTSEVKNYSGGDNYIYKGYYQPYLGYLDIKLCYYFLNLDKSQHRIHYRHKRKD